MKTELNVVVVGDRLVIELVPPLGKPPTIDEDLLDRLEQALSGVDASVRLLVLRSASAKYFCVGANVGVLKSLNEETVGRWVEKGHRVFNLLEDLPIPTVAVVEGYAMGGGVELAMACDFIYAGNEARLGQTEAKLGFVTGWGASYRLPERVGRSVAKQLFYTGEVLSSSRAMEVGLVDFVGDSAGIAEAIGRLEASVVSGSQVAIGSFKRVLNQAAKRERSANASAEVGESVVCIGTEDTKRRVGEFLNRKADRA